MMHVKLMIQMLIQMKMRMMGGSDACSVHAVRRRAAHVGLVAVGDLAVSSRPCLRCIMPHTSIGQRKLIISPGFARASDCQRDLRRGTARAHCCNVSNSMLSSLSPSSSPSSSSSFAPYTRPRVHAGPAAATGAAAGASSPAMALDPAVLFSEADVRAELERLGVRMDRDSDELAALTEQLRAMAAHELHDMLQAGESAQPKPPARSEPEPQPRSETTFQVRRI
jgi:hypothetical protein